MHRRIDIHCVHCVEVLVFQAFQLYKEGLLLYIVKLLYKIDANRLADGEYLFSQPRIKTVIL